MGGSSADWDLVIQQTQTGAVTEIFSLTLNPIKSKVKDDFILTLNQFSVSLIKACEATFPNFTLYINKQQIQSV